MRQQPARFKGFKHHALKDAAERQLLDKIQRKNLGPPVGSDPRSFSLRILSKSRRNYSASAGWGRRLAGRAAGAAPLREVSAISLRMRAGVSSAWRITRSNSSLIWFWTELSSS